ncbi:hypothetical protein DMN91_009593 [Ooceraea biroi]|uniref:Zinc finger HIT domain-containing protein n=1 Tax=Ooceraea biroi TaxID=2015173 RepID=A0A026W371_OOCBI|nr:zinc finger HIT domain-containing protein 3 [Ooceraea biroi]EZA50525.1 Zinc finger HIT domain-containing protein [Ooceraea biroi]RLU17359.1 hypothetical protein DMN91_009593 [Ooceraea biroi]
MLKTCCICEKDNSPYKCPICKKPYCSIACCKQHKTQPCEPPELPEKPEEEHQENHVKYEFPRQDIVSAEKLQQLRHSEELKSCLRNPHVREMMKSIVNSQNMTNAIASAMREPLFVEMVDACLKVVEPQNNQLNQIE